jgi:hypothetical protein
MDNHIGNQENHVDIDMSHFRIMYVHLIKGVSQVVFISINHLSKPVDN